MESREQLGNGNFENNLKQDRPTNGRKPKRNGRNGRIRRMRNKRYGKQVLDIGKMNLKTETNVTHGFGIIDRRYASEVEIMPGMITYKRPITGKITILCHFDTTYVSKILQRSIRRWSETIGYHEIRSLKSIVGLTAAMPITTTIDKVAGDIAKHLLALVYKMVNLDTSINLYMERVGLTNIVVPTFVYDLLHYLSSGNRTHRIAIDNQSMIKCEIKLSTQVIQHYEKIADEFKGVELEDILFHLSSYVTHGKLGDSQNISTFNEFSNTSPLLCNSLLKQKSQDKNFEDVICGYTTTQKDISFAYLYQMNLNETTLPKGAIDAFTYQIEKRRSYGALTNFFVNTYMNVNDVYTQPQVNTPIDEEFDETNIDNVDGVNID